ncbi:flagellar filament capping protein FliD [Hydrogenophaga sp. 5NK40-0174]|uniref:flagellar filament capping protein FliD n=1 Tax=Hydrogenophaga sp. 5NK40-0174 TaxID=3127649 RepID=UPI00310A745D
MATISSPGLATGLDIQGIVSQLVALEKAPLTQLSEQKTSLQTKMSTYGNIKSQFSSLADAANLLKGNGGWDSVTASSSNDSAIKVSAAAGTAPTSISMEVQSLAKAQSIATGSFADGEAVGTGSITIELGAWNTGTFTGNGSTPVSITVGAGEDSLSDIAAAINDAEAGVTATVLKDSNGERLLLRSAETGEENGFRITVDDDDNTDSDGAGLSRLAFGAVNTNGTSQTQAGQNAISFINGVQISTASNTLSDTIAGMTIELKQETTAPVEVSVGIDKESVKGNIDAFVQAYNMINTTIATATRYDPGTEVAGPLQGDSTAVGLQNALRAMMRSVTSGDTYSRLSDIGIEFGEGGALNIDSAKLDAALDGEFQGVKNLFTVDTGDAATEGFGRKIESFAQGLIDADGMISNRREALQKAIERNEDEQDRVNDRASRVEARYLAQYNSMDAAVGRLNALSSFVSQQIALWNAS